MILLRSVWLSRIQQRRTNFWNCQSIRRRTNLRWPLSSTRFLERMDWSIRIQQLVLVDALRKFAINYWFILIKLGVNFLQINSRFLELTVREQISRRRPADGPAKFSALSSALHNSRNRRNKVFKLLPNHLNLGNLQLSKFKTHFCIKIWIRKTN